MNLFVINKIEFNLLYDNILFISMKIFELYFWFRIYYNVGNRYPDLNAEFQTLCGLKLKLFITLFDCVFSVYAVHEYEIFTLYL